MIKRLFVDNYKCLVNFELRLGELVLLMGNNGAGKSSVLDVVFALREVLGGTVKISDSVAFPQRTLTKWQTVQRQVFEMDVETEKTGALTYRLEVEHESTSDRSRVALEKLTAPTGPLFEFRLGTVQLYRDDHSKGPAFSGDWSESWLSRFTGHRDNPRPGRFLEFIRRVVVCGAYPQGISAESRGEDAVIARDAANFAAWYRGLLQERPDLLTGYVAALTEVISGFRGLRLEKVGEVARLLTVAFENSGSPYTLSLGEISDGQRALIVLYALLHLTADQGYTLFLDEPDNYVALAEIQPWLMALSDACGTTLSQAVVCSHHPELIDYLGAERGLLLERESAGSVAVRPAASRAAESGLKLSEVVARGWDA